eukprot:TRINITY_DN14052_c0_g4_i1.p1 TRINITY_DN14052_c0_g4~~TRINITY_DN14052_c0_g4_i1.p1  ORF type:complete len:470 (-),score=112.02 TRINITY_DN14052_c0_g4_i1:1073-2482(-)
MYNKIDAVNSLRDSSNHIVINHLDNIKSICTKDRLIFSLRKFYMHLPAAVTAHYSIHDTTPTTFIVQSNCADNEFAAFGQRFNELSSRNYTKERMPPKHCEKNMWLVKPCGKNQGKGIEIFSSLADIRKFLLGKPMLTSWVVQKYIERPMLYGGRKFDIRVWALVTHKKELYFYRHGYIRTASDSYDLDSRENYVHLTNNCLQKYGKNYGAFEEGNTVSYATFIQYLSEQFPGKRFNFEAQFACRMKDVILDCYLSVKNELNQGGRRNCFELLGFDFLMDDDFRLWLLEVNTNPYLGIPNKYIEGLLPKMINDMFEIVLDPYIKPQNGVPAREVDNQFELIYSEARKINKRRPFTVEVYPFASETYSSERKMGMLAKNGFSALAKELASEAATDDLFHKFADQLISAMKDSKALTSNEQKDIGKTLKILSEGTRRATFFESSLFSFASQFIYSPKCSLPEELKNSVVWH